MQSSDTNDPEEIIFHMAQHELYKSVAASGEAYFRPTFEADGMFTHDTAVPTHIITIVNYLYTGTKGSCICLHIIHSALHNPGVVTKFEELKPVGQREVE